VQGEAGIIVPPDGYLARCAEICRARRVLLICDEVQTGLGRTGYFLGAEHDGVKPDGVILGKALGGGLLPVSAFIATNDVMQVFHPGDHGSTFGGNPLAATVAMAALDVLHDEALVERSRTLGAWLKDELATIDSPLITDVRGRGLFIGIEVDPARVSARQVVDRLLARGILSKDTHGTCRAHRTAADDPARGAGVGDRRDSPRVRRAHPRPAARGIVAPPGPNEFGPGGQAGTRGRCRPGFRRTAGPHRADPRRILFGMPATLAGQLVVAISSRALFDLTDSHRVYTEQGVDAYHHYQVQHEDELLAPGPAFALVNKLLRLNRPGRQYVEVILLSRNSADTGLRVFNAIKHYGLDITRAAFTKGEATSRYVPAFGAHLFLSADTDDVKRRSTMAMRPQRYSALK
jgi:hypothetical protein